MLYISCTPIPNKELYFRPIAEPVPIHLGGDTKPGVVKLSTDFFLVCGTIKNGANAPFLFLHKVHAVLRFFIRTQ